MIEYIIEDTGCEFAPLIITPVPWGSIHTIVDNFPDDDYEMEDE